MVEEDRTPRTEDVEWDRRKHPRCKLSLGLLQQMQPGDVKRIYHPDVSCKRVDKGRACTLLMKLWELKKKNGRKYESYHEAQYIAVVRRLE